MSVPAIGSMVDYYKRAARGGDAYAKPLIIPAEVVWHQPRRESMMTHVKIKYELEGKTKVTLAKLDCIQEKK